VLFRSESPDFPHDFYVVGPGDDLQSVIINSSNKTIYLKKGEYNSIRIGDNVHNLTIRSLDKWNSILNGNNEDYVLELDNTSNISIIGLVFINGVDGLSIKQSKNCIIDDNLILDFKDDGIYLYESIDNTLSKNKISSNYGQNNCGIWLDKSGRNKIIENVINVQSYMIDLHNSSCDNLIINSNNGKIRENNTPNNIYHRGYVCRNSIICDPVNGSIYSCYSELNSGRQYVELEIADYSCNRWS